MLITRRRELSAYVASPRGASNLTAEASTKTQKGVTMMAPLIESPGHDPIASTLSAADDRIILTHWLPPREGIVPQIRIGDAGSALSGLYQSPQRDWCS